MITKFKIFEKYNPMVGDCGVLIDGKYYNFKIGKLNKYVEKHYNAVDIKISGLIKLSLFKDIESDEPNNENDSDVLVDDKWKKYKDLTPDEFKKYKKEQMKILMKADLKYPIIVVVDDKDEVFGVLDGNHRIMKAKITKKDTIKAYKLTKEEAKKISKEL